jgi:hypothetical protein
LGRRYRFKTTPYRHQKRALRHALRHYKGVALFMPMRSGKTKTAIDWVGMLHLKFGVERVLIVAPGGDPRWSSWMRHTRLGTLLLLSRIIYGDLWKRLSPKQE